METDMHIRPPDARITERTAPHSASRLAILVSRCDEWPDPAVLAEARALGPATTAALVNVLLAGALRVHGRDRTAETSCDLAGALRLEATLPRLLALVDAGRIPAALHRAAVRAIGCMGLAALEPLGEALDRSRASVERCRTDGDERQFSAAVARLGRHLEAAAELHAGLREAPTGRAVLAEAQALARGVRFQARLARRA
jgi:hypothetical protein